MKRKRKYRISVYRDPITKQHFEGMAWYIRKVSPPQDNLVMCEVEFDDGHIVYRKIDVNQLARKDQ